MRRRHSRAGGFSLVEMAAAVSVATVALVATASAVTTGAGLARTTAETRAVARESATLVERIRATPFGNVTTAFHNTTHAVTALGGTDSSGTSTVTITDVPTGSARWRVLQVEIVTQWRGVSGDSSRTFTTWISDRVAGSALAGPHVVLPLDGVVR